MDISGIVDATVSHAMSLGLFETVNQHEPVNAPGNGLTCAVWADYIGPVPEASGLTITTAYVIMNVRIYTPWTQLPYDGIDPAMMSATDTLFTAYSGAFSLNGKVRNVDLLGAHGTKLSAKAGYIDQDSKKYRVMTITLPMVVNDSWNQIS